MFERPYEDILQEMIDDVPNHLDKREGGIIHTALAPTAKKVFDLFIQMDRVLELTFASTSEDIYLEQRTAELGIDRKPATYSIREGEFNVDVPIGSRFFVDNLHYVTLEQGKTVPMRCETAGEVGNIPIDGTTMMPIDNIPGLATAVIGRIISVGADVQDDEELYQQYFERISRPATSGNIYHYEQWTKQVSGIRAVKVFPLWDGPGTIKIMVVGSDGRAPSQEKVQEVFEHIETERPIGATVTAAPAIEREINISADLQLIEGKEVNEIKENYSQELATIFRNAAYQTDTVRYSQLATLVLEQSGVIDWQNFLVNGETSNVELSEDEIPVIGSVIFNEFQR